MLSKICHIECPVLKVFDILTSAKVPVDCLFNLSHPKCASDMLVMTINALLFGKELKGDQR